jgi:monofunctional biosynthetic peptidoglycan transglycosylase
MGLTDKGTALFTGNVSLENNGGFASCSSKPTNHDLDGYDGVAVRVKGDGKTYKLSLKDDAVFQGFSYQKSFETKNGEWITVEVPFDELTPTFRGRVMRDQPPIEGRNVKSVGLSISDKQEGPFRLEIDWIKGYHKGMMI